MSDENVQAENAAEAPAGEAGTQEAGAVGTDSAADTAADAAGTDAAATDAAAQDDMVYAYVRSGDAANAHVIRVDEKQLHHYLLDPLKIISYDENGNKIGFAYVGTAWGFTLKHDDNSPEAVRALRKSAEDEGIVFQWTEVTKADWEAKN